MAKANILVVDDEAAIRHFLIRVLEREGYQVAAAADGQEALQVLETSRFDLLLTDLKMDRLDGVSLLREATERYPNLAIILLTGHATVESAVAALRRGATNYLLKPVKNEEIIAAIADGLQRRAREQRRDHLEQVAAQMAAMFQTDGNMSNVSRARMRMEITCGTLSVRPMDYTATLNDSKLELTPTEFRLLLRLARSAGAVVEYVALVQDACGYTCTRAEAQEIIGTHVRNLRRKLGVEPNQPLYVEAVRSIGYRLIPYEGERSPQ